ncbi:30S ribosomal protein S12 methylthiotransferase accessory factor YcaO [Dongshaea marina]|uniref:30S ribosomal protein S12 methylthiotransferase accessory factor YcaO n=1 Tax=Dongshaea marina TaxID=2047966 RepID=UPI000D3EC62E|nr:30S ribosomal protein S12 methylthiotransferase accessory factor YcaO [Dongshaea marina]
MKTFIPSKDAALEETIEGFRSQLAAHGFDIEEVSWLNPLPNVWSVHIHDRNCPQCFTNGKGATKKAALASALGEYIERLSCNYFFADYYLGSELSEQPFVHYPNERWFTIEDEELLPEGMMDSQMWQFYDPEQLLMPGDLIDLQSGNERRGICTLPFERVRDGQTLYIPVNLIGNLYVSNGMAAGNTPAEAKVQALSEIMERYVKNRVIANGLSLPEIPQTVLDLYPATAQTVASLREEGIPLVLFDASLGGEFPVIGAALLHQQTAGCFVSFGAHPRFEVALERTVTELFQGRSLKELDIFPMPTFDEEELADPQNLETHFIDSSGSIGWELFSDDKDFDFVHWDFQGSSSEELQRLHSLCHGLGHDIYVSEYQHLGAYACRILVPGMSEIYPIEELLENNNNRAFQLREHLLSLDHFATDPELCSELLEHLEELELDDWSRVRELIGIAPDKQSPWFTLRLGELKCLLALGCQDHSLALGYAQWTLQMNQSSFSPERLNLYRCLKTVLELKLDENRSLANYRGILNQMFGENLLERCYRTVYEGQALHALPAIDSLNQLGSHKKLIETYQKLQQAKQSCFDKQARVLLTT